ncbi:Uncharacterised protein [Mycobacteroides abscessus subsp. abscessus]|nr:hypothetical protein [Mycobacteroides abscessus]SHR69798.1 Uncharacterised protein [Mycobacteroides abscessus subsp. abscessus]QOF28078.1 hypothetical protein E3G43_001626 [Mycobacteroides abscessus]SHT56630.1 Uncharacterised protein [Mycobacteroides abscessus subsp. abscessus]SID17621.1 Uncharacterised protein [Mycobacteroides abscessus subsp. abscessus]
MVMSGRWRISLDLRRASAVVALIALAVGGAKVTSDHETPGTGFSTVATVAADPTGPTGGGMTGPPGGGSQFQPPGLPPQQPDYQGGINQPPLDQNSGISIYNTGSPGAQQVPGQQGAQQPQQGWDQPAHGTQPPNYSTAPGYTQGPGRPNPDFQAPQQGSQQQPQNEQQAPTQNEAPTQQPTQTQEPKQPENDENQDSRENNCLSEMGVVAPAGYVGSRDFKPVSYQRFLPQGDSKCRSCDNEDPKEYNDNQCDDKYTPQVPVSDSELFTMPCGYIYDSDSKVTPKSQNGRHDYCTSSPDYVFVDFAYSCARHDMCMDSIDKGDPTGPGSKYHRCNMVLQTDLINACNVGLPGFFRGPERAACRAATEAYYAGPEWTH